MNVVYLAGPITLGDPEDNAAQADRAMAALMSLGVAVINPMLTMWAGAASTGGVTPRPEAHGVFASFSHETWVRTSLALVSRCDAVVRLPGESKGADAEVEHARQLGIPVFLGVSAFAREVLAT